MRQTCRQKLSTLLQNISWTQKNNQFQSLCTHISTDSPTFAVLSVEVDENLVASTDISQESTVS